MQIYYINLDRRADRRIFMEQQFDRLGLSAVRLSATTPDQLSATDMAKYCDPRRLAWQTREQLSCSMSHRAAMLAHLATDHNYALILEDDAVLSSRLRAFLEAFEAASPQLDVVRLETMHKRLTLSVDPTYHLAGVRFCRNSGWEAGSAAYIVSRRAARSLVEDDRILRRATDLALFDPSERIARRSIVRQSDPALVVQTQFARRAGVDLASDLGANTSRLAADTAFPFQRRLRRLIYVLDRDVVVAARKVWHRLTAGAQRRAIRFAGD